MGEKILNVLLIDDNPADCRLTKLTLAKSSLAIEFNLETAGNLAEGLELLGNKIFDLVLLDLGLPDSHGLETVDKVYESCSDIPIVVLTGLSDEEIGVRAIKRGASDYLVKSKSYGDLLIRSIRYSFERKRTERLLRDSRERYRRITEAVTDYIYTVMLENGQPLYTIHRDTSISITGYTPEEFTANPSLWIDMVFPDDRDIVRKQNSQCLSCQTVGPLEHRIMRKDGRVRWVKSTLVQHYNEQGELMSYDGLLRDITERREVEEQLEQAKKRSDQMAQKAEAANQSKSEFLNNMSHEMRTPLTSIKAYAKTILRDPAMPEETRQKFLAVIDEQSDRLADLIEDLLEVARIESGRITIKQEIVDITVISKKALTTVKPLAAKKNIELQANISEELPELQADESKIESVLTNLLNNAVKFTPEGGQVSIGVEATNDEMVISVSDTGMGIPKEALSKIFERFSRVDRPGTSTQGSGLGLFIVHNIVTMHNGRIEVESKVDHGTTFTVFLPLVVPEEKVAAQFPGLTVA
jgi:PAS domain S-box-containing protein